VNAPLEYRRRPAEDADKNTTHHAKTDQTTALPPLIIACKNPDICSAKRACPLYPPIASAKADRAGQQTLLIDIEICRRSRLRSASQPSHVTRSSSVTQLSRSARHRKHTTPTAKLFGGVLPTRL
jgi:hypothetical protein